MDAFWGYLQIDAFAGTCKLEPCKLMEHFVYIYSILFCSGTGPNDIKNVLGIANEIIDYNLAIFYAHISDLKELLKNFFNEFIDFTLSFPFLLCLIV